MIGAAVMAKRRRKHLGEGRLVDAIRPGCRVTITTPHGHQRTGRAVMRGPVGWVLNMGGRHGTPAIATDDNTNRVVCPRRK